ncbi:MAG: hypothetical protein C0404_00865 [Verrucomicrobia bacterium]|nr:hypothetical protein [Verrucomicrobiota bacterium]
MNSAGRSGVVLVFAIVLCFATDWARAGDVASVTIKGTITTEPTWHNYGSTYTDAQGNVQTLNMPMPFFHTISIDTTVLVSLGHIDIVVGKMQAARINGNTDLMVAATAGDLDAVRQLLAKNAMVSPRNTFGSTALMGAAAGGHKEIVKLLMDKGARVNEKNGHGYTALMLAAKNGHKEVVDLLLDSKADVNTADSRNNTALMYAVNGGRAGIVKTLVEKGAKVDYTSRLGISPLALASHKDNKEIVAILTKPAATGKGS